MTEIEWMCIAILLSAAVAIGVSIVDGKAP